MVRKAEIAWAQETNQDGVRLYDVLTVPCNSSGAPCNLAAEREYLPQTELHARVMAPMAASYRRAVVHPSGPLHSIYVMTYDEAGVLYEILVIGRA